MLNQTNETMPPLNRLSDSPKAHIFNHIDDLRTLESFATVNRHQYETFHGSLASHYKRLSSNVSSSFKKLCVVARLAIQHSPGHQAVPSSLRAISWSIGPYHRNLLKAIDISLPTDVARIHHPDALILRERYLQVRELRLASLCRVLLKVAPKEDWQSLEVNYSRQPDEINLRKKVKTEQWEAYKNLDAYIDH